MDSLKKVATSLSLALVTLALVTALASPAIAAWRSTMMGPYTTQAECETRRSAYEDSPLHGTDFAVGQACYYYTSDPSGRGRGAGWYFYYQWNNA